MNLLESNKDVILKYKNENFIFLTSTFFIFYNYLDIMLLGFVQCPLLDICQVLFLGNGGEY